VCISQLALILVYLDFVRRDLHNELRSTDVFTTISISPVTRHSICQRDEQN